MAELTPADPGAAANAQGSTPMAPQGGDAESGQDQFLGMVDMVARQVDEDNSDYAKKAFGLHRDSFPRKQIIQIVSNVWFDRIVLTLIMINCLTMILFASPLIKNVVELEYEGKCVTEADVPVSDRSLWVSRTYTFYLLKPMSCDCTLSDLAPCSIAQVVDFIFLLCFTIEMVLKMGASGLLFHRKAYFYSGWNWLDFIVVTVGWLEIFAGGMPAIKSIRLIKTLRPLRSMQRIRGLRVLVQCILEALPQMVNVGVFLIFTLVLFGLFGHAFFAGKLRHTCHEWDGSEWVSTGETCDAMCKWDEKNPTKLDGPCQSLGNLTNDDNFLPSRQNDLRGAHFTYSCQRGQECRCTSFGTYTPFDSTSGLPLADQSPDLGFPLGGQAVGSCDYLSNPNYGITSFDSLPWAMVSLFQAISLEGWVDMMYQLMDGCSVFVIAYFILLVLFGAIIVMNLFLAVLCDNFEMADRDGEPEVKEEDPEEAVKKALATLAHENKYRQMCLTLVRMPWFDYFIQGCILFNTLIMCLKWAPYPEDYKQPKSDICCGGPDWDYLTEGHGILLMTLNILLTTIFTAESIIKVVALGPQLFKKDYMNIFDAFVVLFSIIEIALDLNSKADPDAEKLPLPLSVLRAFRVFRLFKLVKSVESMRKILATLASSLASVVYLAMLLFIMIVIFILLGMELFGGQYPHPELNYTRASFPRTFNNNSINWGVGEEASRYNFDDFGTAMLAIFVVLSGENWNEIMFDSHRASWDVKSPFPYAILYFLLLFVIGNLLLFNLFIAILLSNFDDDEAEEAEEDDEEFKGSLESMPSGASIGTPPKAAEELDMQYVFGAYRSVKEARKSQVGGPNGVEEEAPAKLEEDEAVLVEDYPHSVADGMGDMSLKLFGWDSPVRIFCCKTIRHKWFEPTVLTLILVSTLFLVIDMPHLSEQHPLRVVLNVFNYIFTVLFTIEMVLKIVAQGFVFSKTPKKYELAQPYIRSGWNQLDFFIVFVSILALALPKSVKGVKQLRAFRAIRPMRLVSRYESLKITFQTLLMSIPSMLSLMSVALLFFVIFSILGLELFGGRLGYCYDPQGGGVVPGMGLNGTQNDYEECMLLPRYNLSRRTSDGILLTDMADAEPDADPSWLLFTEYPQWLYPQFGTFDNVGMAMMLLFEISALEGWPDVMHWVMDADGKNMLVNPYRWDTNVLDWGNPADLAVTTDRPQEHFPALTTDEHVTSNIEAAIFFILWIIFGCFVIVNMTIGVVVDTFGQIKAENDGVLMMTDEAAEWVKTQKQVLAQRPLRAAEQPKDAWRLNFYYLVTSAKFEVFIMVVILLNMLQMGTDWFEPHPDSEEVMVNLKLSMNAVNAVFLTIYILEAGLKWVGLGVYQYFNDNWNRFDFFLVIISIVDLILAAQEGDLPFPASVLRVLRLFRVARILRIVKTAKQLRTIMMTVYISVPQLKNILVLMCLIILVADMLLVGFFYAVSYTPGNYEASYDFYENNLPSDAEFSSATSGAVTSAATNLLYGATYRGEVYHQPDSPASVPASFAGTGLDGTGTWYWPDSAVPNTNWGGLVNRHANFATFWVGLLTLVRSSTGESFNLIMHDLAGWEWGDNRLRCSPQGGPVLDGEFEKFVVKSTGETIYRVKPSDSCGLTIPSWVIYFIFQMVMAYIVLSIMIGVILENFANVGSETKNITMEDIEDFREVWLKYDPKGTFVVPSHNLLAILQQLKKPLGIQGAQPPLTRSDMLKHLGKLDIPDHNGFIHFTETLTAVCNEEAGTPLPGNDTTKKLAKATNAAPRLNKLEKPAHNALTNYLVSLLQSRWRGYSMRRNVLDGSTDSAAGAEPSATPLGKVKANQVAPGPT